MRLAFLPLLMAVLLPVCLASCAGTRAAPTRTLCLIYTDDGRELKALNMFDEGSEARGSVRPFWDKKAAGTKVTLPISDFNEFWNRLDESKLAPHSMRAHPRRDESADDKYMIGKGFMPNDMDIYAIPKSNASADIRSWVRAFRAKTKTN